MRFSLLLSIPLQISRRPESILAPERPDTEMGFPSALTSRPFSRRRCVLTNKYVSDFRHPLRPRP